MLQAFVVAAAEQAESSKTAFYVLGGLLAVWAVALSAIGLTRPSFPGTDGAARGVMGLTVVLVAAALAASIVTA